MYEYNFVLKILDDFIEQSEKTIVTETYGDRNLRLRAEYAIFVLIFFREVLKKEIDKQMALMGAEMDKEYVVRII